MVSHRAQEIAVSLVKFGCCAILGAAGGHLGMLTLGLFTAASGSGHEAVNSGSEAVKFGSEKVVEFLAELGFESSRPSNPGLEALYTEALRLSFRHIREAAETPS